MRWWCWGSGDGLAAAQASRLDSARCGQSSCQPPAVDYRAGRLDLAEEKGGAPVVYNGSMTGAWQRCRTSVWRVAAVGAAVGVYAAGVVLVVVSAMSSLASGGGSGS